MGPGGGGGLPPVAGLWALAQALGWVPRMAVSGEVSDEAQAGMAHGAQAGSPAVPKAGAPAPAAAIDAGSCRGRGGASPTSAPERTAGSPVQLQRGTLSSMRL
jgi:hypothetical protein